MKLLILIFLILLHFIFVSKAAYTKSYQENTNPIRANLQFPEVPKRPTLEELAVSLTDTDNSEYDDAKAEILKHKNSKLRKLINEAAYKENKK